MEDTEINRLEDGQKVIADAVHALTGRLDTQIALSERTEQMIERLVKVIYGNGSKGLLSRMDVVEAGQALLSRLSYLCIGGIIGALIKSAV